MSRSTGAFDGRVGAMRGLSLTEIDERAELQTRVDRKYVVSLGVLDELSFGTDPGALDIADRRDFGYATTYFDTPNRDLYLDTAYRRPRRFKVRLRVYVDSGLTMLEVKRKDGRGNTVKVRREFTGGEVPRRLSQEMTAFVDDEVDTEHTTDLALAATTRFRRTTIVDTENAARYTVDRGLGVESADHRCVELRKCAVVECKSANGPTPLDRQLWSFGVRPARMSKYCTALAILEPALPANYWCRTIERHFGGRRRVA